jgi:hypothetical protein
MSDYKIIHSSFRDPSGFLFYRNGSIYRNINICYKENYDHLMNSGLYNSLIKNYLLVPHKECLKNSPPRLHSTYKIIEPEKIPFISYPYEWCFSQLKQSALTTLKIQKLSMRYGMSLKDSSAYNIQFIRGKPIFIDTLSFEKYHEGVPWVAYRQFCQHFLAPLLLMKYLDVSLNQLLRTNIDGVPLALVSKILPWKTKFSPSIFMHIHMHAKSQKRSQKMILYKKNSSKKFSKMAFKGLIDSLYSLITSLNWVPTGTQWGQYYQAAESYEPRSFAHKKRLIADFFKGLSSSLIVDLGSNNGIFSRIAASDTTQIISADMDPACVEDNYLTCKKEKRGNLLPLLIDLTNPSTAIGWQNKEREPFIERCKNSTVMALALIHHLAIGNNLPLRRIADFFAQIADQLVIEFVPKTDKMVESLLANRDDIFTDYNQENFEKEFIRHFQIIRSEKIVESNRTLYLLKRN